MLGGGGGVGLGSWLCPPITSCCESNILCIGLSLNEMPHRAQQSPSSHTGLMDLETLTIA